MTLKIKVHPIHFIKRILAYIKRNPVLISALCALISLGFSIFIYFRTNLILKPFARPIFSPVEQGYNNPLKKINYVFKNIGNHPASNIRFICGYSPADKPELFKITENIIVANSIDQNNVLTWTSQIDYEEGARIYFALEYCDLLYMNEQYINEFWFVFRKDLYMFMNAALDDKKLLLPYVVRVFPERKKYFKDEATPQPIPSSSQMNDLLRKFRLNKR